MAPVYHSLKRLNHIEPIILSTGQHREQLQQALKLFDVPIAMDLDLMKPNQSLEELGSRMMTIIPNKLRELNADYVLVHGDTLTTFIGAWSSFISQIPVGHVEAGLRSFDLLQPFPEEANRRLTDILTDLNLAPTDKAKQNLLDEGKSASNIVVTGQTGVDAVLMASKKGVLPAKVRDIKKPIITVTLHRRENWDNLTELAESLSRLAEKFQNYHFVYPVHLNPIVQKAVKPVLNKIDNFSLSSPLEYGQMVALLAQSDLIITDSGGLQEEGAALNIPVVVARNVTERQEGVDAGILTLAGNNGKGLFNVVNNILSNDEVYNKMKNSPNPFGDGNASKRVAEAVSNRLGIGELPNDWSY